MAITLEITTGSSLEVVETTTELTINSAAMPSAISSSNVIFSGYKNITATNIEEAIQQLADNSFSQATEPTSNLNEGDTWYNTSQEQFYVYRETSPSVMEWVPIILGDAGGDSDTLDAGAF